MGRSQIKWKYASPHWPHCAYWPKKSVLVQTRCYAGCTMIKILAVLAGAFVCWDHAACLFVCQHCLVFEIKHILMLKATTVCAAKKGPMPSIALVQGRARLLVLVLCSQVGVIYCSSGHLYCTNEHWVHRSNRKRNESQRSPICTGICSRYARNVHSCNEHN